MSSHSAEWLEADGEGGFASGTVSGERTRRYHALLLTATTPPTGRMVLVDGLEVWAQTDAGSFALSSQRYGSSGGGDIVHPDGASRIAGFDSEPWPAWRFRVPTSAHGDCIVVQEIFAAAATTVVRWFLEDSTRRVRLSVRPLLSGRDYHSLHHENPAFDFTPERKAKSHWVWRPYEDVPPISIACNASYEHAPEWYRNFAMTARSLPEQARLMAMIWVAQADAGNACFESKYFYQSWRPASAIVLDGDGNAATVADPAWAPVVPTPNHPEYPAAHSCVSAAMAEVLRSYYGTADVTFDMTSMVTGSSHHFTTTTALVDEVQIARIAGGMHFRSATVDGAALGKSVGAWVAANAFKRR